MRLVGTTSWCNFCLSCTLRLYVGQAWLKITHDIIMAYHITMYAFPQFILLGGFSAADTEF